MIFKHLLTTLMVLAFVPVQSATQYPDLNHNYESIWRANINDLNKDFTYIADDPYSMYLKDTGQVYSATGKKPIDFKNIKTILYRELRK